MRRSGIAGAASSEYGAAGQSSTSMVFWRRIAQVTPLTHCLSWSMCLGRPLSVFTRPMTSLNPHRHLVVAHEGVAGVNAGLGVCALGAFAEVLLLVLAEER